MPMVSVFTNASKSLITESFAALLGKLIGRHLDVSDEHVTVRVVPDQLIFTGGKSVPFVHVDVMSIGGLSQAKNAEMTPDITKIVEENLNISAEKILISFYRVDPTYVGINGKTFPPDFNQ